MQQPCLCKILHVYMRMYLYMNDGPTMHMYALLPLYQVNHRSTVMC